MQQDIIFDLKGQARRLRSALQEMAIPVQHAAALNLIARAQGHKNWETLEAALSGSAQSTACTTPVSLSNQAKSLQWLNWLEAAMLSQGYCEQDMDDLIHDTYSGEDASSVNNQGLRAQLGALYDLYLRDAPSDEQRARKLTVEHLEGEYGNLELPLPESKRSQGHPDLVIPLLVSIFAGSPSEQAVEIDALEWFANQDIDAISTLVLDGLGNTHMSDDVVLWLESHSLNAPQCGRLRDMLAHMRNVQAKETAGVSHLVGITANIDREALASHIETRVSRGENFSADVLGKLELSLT